jgi:hypothetical protein
VKGILAGYPAMGEGIQKLEDYFQFADIEFNHNQQLG